MNGGLLYLGWSLPALVVFGAIATGRVGILTASLMGLFTALVSAIASAPKEFSIDDAGIALMRGPDGQFKIPQVWSVKLLHP